MDLNKPPKTALSTLVRKALTNRYDFEAVKIDRDGNVSAVIDLGFVRGKHMTATSTYGNLSMWSWERTDSMGIRIRFQFDPAVPSTTIFTFASDN